MTGTVEITEAEARKRAMIEANKSFYSSTCWLVGLLIGFAHFSVLTAGEKLPWILLARYGLPLAVVGLLMNRKRISKGSLQVTLMRTYPHIFGDLLVSAALVSTFAVVTFMMTRGGLSTLGSEDPNREQVLLGLNLACFVTGMVLLRYYSRLERN
jgi:hypothetical protein